MSQNPRENPQLSSSPRASDDLLRNFRATLETRWNEFDRATLQEAISQNPLGNIWAESLRNSDPDFINAKATFDEAKNMLQEIPDDAALRTNPQVLLKVENALKKLTEYLASVKPEEKAKSHNIILAKTKADLAEFKAKITEKPEDKKEAINAIKDEQSIVQSSVTAWAGGISLMNEAQAAVREATGEATSEIQKAMGPWGMILKWVQNTPIKEVAAQVKSLAKDASEKKWTEDPFEKLFSMIQLFLLKWQIGRAWIDISSDMTDEEMRLAGIAVNPGLQSKDRKREVPQTPKIYSTVIAGIVKIAPEEAQKWGIHALLWLESVRKMKIEELNKYAWKPNELLHTLGDIGWLDEKGASYVLSMFFDTKNSIYKILRARYTKSNPEKNINEATIEDVLSSIWNDVSILSFFRSIDLTDYQGSLNKIGESLFSYNASKWEVSGEIVEKAKSMGISSRLLVHFLALDNKQAFKDKKSVEALKSLPDLTQEDKSVIEKIGDFWEKFMLTMTNDKTLNMGNGEQVKNIISKNNISFSDIMKAYILTWGQTNISSMDTIHKIGAYTAFMLIVWQDSAASGAMTGSIINLDNIRKLAQNGTDPFDVVPEDVRDFFKDTVSLEKVWGQIEKALGGLGSYVKEFAKNSPWLSAFLIMAVMFLPIFSKKTNLANMFSWGK